MSMFTYVNIGISIDTDEAKKMAEVWYACENAGIEVPENVYNFFDGTKPSKDIQWISAESCTVNDSDEETETEYWEIDISNLPKNAKLIRFCNSY